MKDCKATIEAFGVEITVQAIQHHRMPTPRPQWRYRVVSILVMLALLSLSGKFALATDGLESIGVSMQARARGGADVAVGDSAVSQIANPATLTLRPQALCQFDFSGQLVMPTIHWSTPIDSMKSDGLHPLANMAISIPVNERLTAGIGLHAKSGLITKFRARHLLIPFMRRRVGSDFKNASLSLNAGYKLADKLSIGGGLRAEILTCSLDAVLGPAAVSLDRGYASGGGFDLGIHYQPTESLALGVAYHSPTWFGDVSGGDAKAALLGLVPTTLGEGNVDTFRLPQQVQIGAAWDVNEWLKLVGESRWINWKRSSFNSATLAIDGPIDLRLPMDVGYRDMWVLIAGAEFKLDEHWTLAMGYNYASNPTPRSHLFPFLSSMLQHHITVGLRYEKDNWWVGAGYIYGFRASVKGAGHSDILMGLDYGFSEVSHQQHSMFFGFGFSLQESLVTSAHRHLHESDVDDAHSF